MAGALAIAVVSAGIGGAVAVAVHSDHGTTSTMVTAQGAAPNHGQKVERHAVERKASTFLWAVLLRGRPDSP